jgi:hypothetical protein
VLATSSRDDDTLELLNHSLPNLRRYGSHDVDESVLIDDPFPSLSALPDRFREPTPHESGPDLSASSSDEGLSHGFSPTLTAAHPNPWATFLHGHPPLTETVENAFDEGGTAPLCHNSQLDTPESDQIPDTVEGPMQCSSDCRPLSAPKPDGVDGGRSLAQSKTLTGGKTALHLAAEYGKAAHVRLLLPYCRDPCERDATGQTALHLAVRNRHLDATRTLLDYAATPADGCRVAIAPLNVNVQDDEGQSALHKAVLSGDPKMVQLLLDTADVDVQLSDTGGQTALHLAAIGESDAIVGLLLHRSCSDRSERCDV